MITKQDLQAEISKLDDEIAVDNAVWQELRSKADHLDKAISEKKIYRQRLAMVLEVTA
jgi:rRNA-processing protein FCF1